MKCRYRYCGAELPRGINGNRRYCDDDCNDAERLEREREKYGTRKTILTELSRIETLLRIFYNRYGDTPFDVSVIRELKMNWTIYSDTLKHKDIDFRFVGSYGYAVFQNDTIQIIKR